MVTIIRKSGVQCFLVILTLFLHTVGRLMQGLTSPITLIYLFYWTRFSTFIDAINGKRYSCIPWNTERSRIMPWTFPQILLPAIWQLKFQTILPSHKTGTGPSTDQIQQCGPGQFLCWHQLSHLIWYQIWWMIFNYSGLETNGTLQNQILSYNLN